MMFSCCHPRLPEEAQVALVLHILCGFGVGEIASAFLSSARRRSRSGSRAARRCSRGVEAPLRPRPTRDFAARLAAVQRALYLLFNEGYHGASAESAVRVELCDEAMRLVTLLLLEHPPAATPATHALAALMCLHAARLPARVDAAGDLSPLFEQDRSRWDPRLVARGRSGCSSGRRPGPSVSEYHVEAAIACVHADARTVEETRWDRIVSLYDTLIAMRPSPVVALKRAIAVAQAPGRTAASTRSTASRSASDSRRTRSTTRRWASSSCGADSGPRRGALPRRARARAQPDGAPVPRGALARAWPRQAELQRQRTSSAPEGTPLPGNAPRPGDAPPPANDACVAS